jgi:hypothetical protein
MDELTKIIQDIKDKLSQLERGLSLRKITIPADGYLVLDSQTADPVTVTNGRLFYNSTSNQLKVGINGSWKVVTVS